MGERHTPGPFTAESATTSNYLWEVTRLSQRGKRRVVARIASGSESKEADARLFAAAPELYEALKALSAMYAATWDRVDGDLVMMGETVDKFEIAHQQAAAALAKARGEV